MRELGVAVLGCGTVGQAALRLLNDHESELTSRVEARLVVRGVGVRDVARPRDVDPSLLTSDTHGLVTRDDVDVVVEVVGGLDPAREWLLAALKAGKSVVTANKELLARDAAVLHEAAESSGVDILYEAAVAGAIPLLRSLRGSLHGDKIRRVLGIVNGTCNYILSEMSVGNASFADSLVAAQAQGFAEADPSADVDGRDAAAKAAILASLAFHSPVTLEQVTYDGIRGVTPADIVTARDLGSVIKQLCIAERGSAGVGVRVHTAMIPHHHPLANVSGPYNAVFVEAEAAGELMFYGPGAGGVPTASAVVGDLVASARNRIAGVRTPSPFARGPQAPVVSADDAVTRCYVRLAVADRPGVLAQVASVFAAEDVSIATVRQEGRGSEAELVTVTHAAREAALARTVQALGSLEPVQAVTSVIRVEG